MEYYKNYSLYYMNIQQLKVAMSTKANSTLTSLSMIRQFEKDGKTPSVWVSSWDDMNRVRVTMHEDIMNQLKNNPQFDGLAFKHKTVEEHKTPTGELVKAYQHLIVITPQNIEATF